jgi:uncharacterized membrane protein YeiH
MRYECYPGEKSCGLSEDVVVAKYSEQVLRHYIYVICCFISAAFHYALKHQKACACFST